MRVWVDMDGVWADFDAQYEHHFGFRPNRNVKGHDTDWDRVRSVPDFFLTIPPMPDWMELHAGLTELVGPTWGVITGVPKEVDAACNHKRDWIASRFTPVPETICCASRDKCLHGEPGDVLIDDYLKYRHLWEGMGGVFIHHTSAAESIRQLRQLVKPRAPWIGENTPGHNTEHQNPEDGYSGGADVWPPLTPKAKVPHDAP